MFSKRESEELLSEQDKYLELNWIHWHVFAVQYFTEILSSFKMYRYNTPKITTPGILSFTVILYWKLFQEKQFQNPEVFSHVLLAKAFSRNICVTNWDIRKPCLASESPCHNLSKFTLFCLINFIPFHKKIFFDVC